MATKYDDLSSISSYDPSLQEQIFLALVEELGRTSNKKITEGWFNARSYNSLNWFYNLAMSYSSSPSAYPKLIRALDMANMTVSSQTSVNVPTVYNANARDVTIDASSKLSRFLQRNSYQSSGPERERIAPAPGTAYNANPDVYDPSASKPIDFSDKYKLRQVQGEMSKLKKNEKWSLLIGKERILFDTEEEAVSNAKKRAKECDLYHHIQEVDANGKVQHSEDRLIGTIGYIDQDTKERALFTYRGGTFASADKKSKTKSKKGGKYYL